MTSRILGVIVATVAIAAAACTTPGGTGGGPGSPPIALRGVDNAWRHTCAVDRDGQAWCWGEADTGEVGNGVAVGQWSTPQQVTGISDAIDVATGFSHSCALRESGSVWCWGENDKGQLGDNTLVNSSTPVEVRGLIDATSVAAGGDFTCATRENSRVVCWGTHDSGQLGAGVLWLWADHSPTPLLVPDLFDAEEVVAGQFHACARRSGGEVSCWGSGQSGRLGIGSSPLERLTPVSVPGLSGVTDIAAGSSNTCVLTPGGHVQCWGPNSSGAASGTPGPTAESPTPVVGAPAAVSVEVGSSNACARRGVGRPHLLGIWGVRQARQRDVDGRPSAGALSDRGRRRHRDGLPQHLHGGNRRLPVVQRQERVRRTRRRDHARADGPGPDVWVRTAGALRGTP